MGWVVGWVVLAYTSVGWGEGARLVRAGATVLAYTSSTLVTAGSAEPYVVLEGVEELRAVSERDGWLYAAEGTPAEIW